MFRNMLLITSGMLLAADTGAGSTPPEAEIPGENKPVDLKQAPGNRVAEFEQVLKDFVRATNTSKAKAKLASEMAREHFQAHGDTSFYAKLAETIKKHANNYVRLQAYLVWVTAFAPVKIESGKFLKDKERAEGFDWDAKVELDGKHYAYTEIAFWDFEPEKPIKQFDADDIMEAMLSTLKRFTGKKYEAKDETATLMLESMEAAVKAVVKPHVAPEAGQQKQAA